MQTGISISESVPVLPSNLPYLVCSIEGENIPSSISRYDRVGTGFFYRSGWTYLVTAKHVLLNEKNALKRNRIRLVCHSENSDESFSYDIDLQIVMERKGIFFSERDIVAVRLAQFVGSKHPAIFFDGVSMNSNNALTTTTDETQIRVYENIKVFSDIVLFGFPSSLDDKFLSLYGINMEKLQIDKDWPLFKGGKLACKNNRNKTIILDGAVYPGNSGSPVFVIEEDRLGNKSIYLAGVAIQFIPYVQVAKDEQIGVITNISIQNSGYSVAESAENISNLIHAAERGQ